LKERGKREQVVIATKVGMDIIAVRNAETHHGDVNHDFTNEMP
jgi:aryl-alcohol dehydrogenase-like predicted oxidoreductase